MIHSDHSTDPTVFTINSYDLNQGSFVFMGTCRPYVKISGWGRDNVDRCSNQGDWIIFFFCGLLWPLANYTGTCDVLCFYLILAIA